MWYISHHPAEKVGIFSTFDYIYQRAQGISKVFHGWKKGEVDELAQYKTSFNELNQVISSDACEEAVLAGKISKDNINQIIQNLESTTAEEFNHNKSKYITAFAQMNELINKHCN